MIATFFRFAKRENSTKVPELESGYDIEVALKEDCDVLHPVIIVDQDLEVWNSNYAYIESFRSRFYFVTGQKIMANRLMEISLSVDVLATKKDSLLSISTYVLRSASNYDTSVIDSLYPATCKTGEARNVINFFGTVGCYIVGILGGASSSSVGSVTYYAMEQIAVLQLMQFMFNSANFEKEISDEVVKTFFNPSQYVVSCMYCPVNLIPSASQGTYIDLGWFESNARGFIQNPTYNLGVFNIDIPRVFPDDLSHWVNCGPISTYRLYIPCYGILELDSALISNDESIRITASLDVATGSCHMQISAMPSGTLVSVIDFNICANIPLAQSRIDDAFGLAIGSGIRAVGDFVSGFSESFGESLSTIGNNALASLSQVSTQGGATSIARIQGNRQFVLQRISKGIVERSTARFGQPLCKTVNLGTLSGYCKCKDANYNDNGLTRTELNMINDYMNGGFYIE